MKSIDVTCAILIRNQKLLACLRGEGSDHAFEWEFPGGKVEPDEAAESCIVREMKEELGIDVRVIKQLKSVHHNYSSKRIHLIPFLCEIVNGEPGALEHSELCWQPFSEFDVLNWSDADRELYKLNRTEIECWPY